MLYSFFCLYKTFSLVNFEHAKLLQAAFGCPRGLVASSAGIQPGPGDRGEGGRTTEIWTLEKPSSAGGADGQGQVSVPLTSRRLLPASGRRGLRVPRAGAEPTPTVCAPPGGWNVCVRPQLSWAQVLGRRGPGRCAHSSGGAPGHSSVEGRGGVVDIRRLPSWINRNSLSRSF